MDSFSIGQSGEQDAREKEMEENMNEVFDTFFHIIVEQQKVKRSKLFCP
jgi:hypothetical protein